MKGVVLSAQQLFTRRPKRVWQLLLPLARPQGLTCSFERVARGGGKALGVHQSARQPSTPAREWRFSTPVDGIEASYFEWWKPNPTADTFRLEQAYFTLFDTMRERAGRPLELIAIHADPCCTDGAPLGTYKRGPHLHIEVAPDPVPRCHIPLHLRHLPDVLTSVESLTSAFAEVFAVIQHDLFPRLARAG